MNTPSALSHLISDKSLVCHNWITVRKSEHCLLLVFHSMKRMLTIQFPYQLHSRVLGKPAFYKRTRTMTIAKAAPQLDFLKGISVVDVNDASMRDVLSLWDRTPGQKCLLAFLTHWGDLGSWEYAQRLSTVLDKLDQSGN